MTNSFTSKCSLRVVVCIPCSSRKRLSPEPSMCAQNLVSGNIEVVAKAWGECLRDASTKHRPEQVYCGRAYREGKFAAECINGIIFVISAGYGLVSENDEIAPYSLTVTSGQVDSINRNIRKSEWSPNAWWQALGTYTQANTNLRSLLKKMKPDLILISLSTGYGHLIADDLQKLTEKTKRRLRIFCAGKRSPVPPELNANIMPYDNRLDGPNSPIRGTMSDFSCRALHHYARCLRDGLIKGVDLTEDKACLESIMASWTLPEKPNRIRQTNDEIIAFISDTWSQSNGRLNACLRSLRDSGRACEQNRFRDLFQKIAKEKNKC